MNNVEHFSGRNDATISVSKLIKILLDIEKEHGCDAPINIGLFSVRDRLTNVECAEFGTILLSNKRPKET